MKKRYIIMFVFTFLVFICTAFFSMNKSYSYGLTTQLSGKPGNMKILYFDATTGKQITYESAKEYYGAEMYEYQTVNGKTVYFEKGIEVVYDVYLKGKSIEDANNRANAYGQGAYRVHTTEEFKKAFDDIYNNLRVGKFYIEYSRFENIDFYELTNYINQQYTIISSDQNYYTYSIKGLWEPRRFKTDLSQIKDQEEYVLDTNYIRISGNERVVVDDFANKIVNNFKNYNSDYEKILATFKFIQNKTKKISDNTYTNDTLSSNTSAYDALIERKATSVGAASAFSLIMDKLGIESYIVDKVDLIDEGNQIFKSSHSFNVVKLNNKFYKIDIFNDIFLTKIKDRELYDNALQKATSDYPNKKTVTVDYSTLDRLLNSSKSINTTTTKRIEGITTHKTYPYTAPNGSGGKSTTTANNRTTNGNEHDNIRTTTVRTNEYGEEITTEYVRITTTKKQTQKTTKKRKFKIEITKNINLDFIYKIKPKDLIIPGAILAGVILILFLIFHKRQINMNSERVQSVLNRDIIRKDENEENNNNNNE